jgi:uncharacterized membrane protein
MKPPGSLLMSLESIASAAFSLDAVYVMTAVVLVIFAVMTFRDRGNPRRIGSGLFWLTLAIVFCLGSLLPYWLTGLLVLLMVGIDGVGGVRLGRYNETSKSEHAAEAARLRNRIFLPVVLIPLVVFAFALIFRVLHLDVNKGALVGLGFGGVVAMASCMKLTGDTARSLMEEGRRLNDAIGTVSILPQLLASLGVIFTAARIGDLIAGGIHRLIPDNNLFLLVMANCLGMALFTIVMGNSFAAFPVIATGVLSPLIIQPLGVNPSMVAIITLTAGSTGTLITPMAANFNIVPTALLNMRNQYGVIRFQLPYALTIWTAHVVLMWLMIRFSA